MKPNLITEEYRAQQAQLHATGLYGLLGFYMGGRVSKLRAGLNAKSVLDYGCGSRRSLLETLELPEGVVYEGYDPCVPAYAADPVPAELVVCLDVLEHIEPELLDNVLDHLASLCDPHGFFSIHTGPAEKVLADGRNAHIIQKPSSWWLPRLLQRFELLQFNSNPRGFEVLVRSLQA